MDIISAYKENAKGSSHFLPNRFLEAFSPEVFNAVGYPTPVQSKKQLWRYVDVMHETGFPGILDLFLGALTNEEFELFKLVVKKPLLLVKKPMGKLWCPNHLFFGPLSRFVI